MTERASILIADDQPENLLILEAVLSGRYAVRSVSDGRQALDVIEARVPVDLVLLDIMMPVIDGFEVCRRLKASPATSDIPILFLTGLDGDADEAFGLALGAEDFIHKPFSPPVVLARIRTHLRLRRATLQLRRHNEELERLVVDRTREIEEKSKELLRRERQLVAAQDVTISAFCSLAETRDPETGNHIRRTQLYIRALAEALRGHPRFRRHLDDETVELLYKSAPLHDVGKVGIPDAILLKPGPLTLDEWVIMRRHCEYGRDAIARAATALGAGDASFLRHAMDIAHCHHERWNGTGYPRGLAGDAIPVSARLMAAADVYDALICRRVYKEPIPHPRAIAEIAAQRGLHFDPDITDALVGMAPEFNAIAARHADGPLAS